MGVIDLAEGDKPRDYPVFAAALWAIGVDDWGGRLVWTEKWLFKATLPEPVGEVFAVLPISTCATTPLGPHMLRYALTTFLPMKLRSTPRTILLSKT
jgi:hypothetical protein